MCKETDSPLDNLDSQQFQPSWLNPDLQSLLHSELEANPDAPSTPKFDAALKEYLQAQFGVEFDEVEDQPVVKKGFWWEFFDREQNFFNGNGLFTIEWEFYEKLHNLFIDIEADIQKYQGISSIQMLKDLIFSRVYDFVILQNDDYSLFDNTVVIYEDAFDVCFFMSLCMFLYETKRLRGKSLRKFIYDHSPRGYNIKGSPNYFDYESMSRNFRESNSDKPERSSTLINSDDAKLRQFQKRLRVQRPVHHDSTEWSAMRMVSEHEWTLHFFMNEENDLEPSKDDDEETKKELGRQANERKRIRDTYKRIRNLYTGIYEAINSKMDDKYIERLDTAAKKFCSKLNKLQYERYLELGNFCLDHINKDKTCYGINLYRFEKELQLYRITIVIDQLLNCNDNAEKDCIIDLAMRMVNIIFPKLYNYFSNLPDIRQTQFYANTFWSFMDETIQSSRLIIDKFVEDGVFGDDWEQLFLKVTNELAETVLYDPSKINYSITPDSQREFQIYLLKPVDYLIMQKKSQYFQSLPLLVADDDDV